MTVRILRGFAKQRSQFGRAYSPGRLRLQTSRHIQAVVLYAEHKIANLPLLPLFR